MRSPAVHRIELATDRPGEQLTFLDLPEQRVSIVQATNSSRHWSEYHDHFAVAAVDDQQSDLVARWSYRGKTLEATENSAMVMQPGELHVTRQVSRPARFFVVKFPSEFVHRIGEELELGRQINLKTNQLSNPELLGRLRRLKSAADAAAAMKAGTDPEISSLLAKEVESRCHEALVSLLVGCGEASVRPIVVRDFLTRKALAELDSWLETGALSLQRAKMTKPTIPSLAKVLGVPESTLWHGFKGREGITLSKYLAIRRFTMACRRLERGEAVSAVADHLGFSSHGHFTRWFRKFYGLAPSQWPSHRTHPMRRAS